MLEKAGIEIAKLTDEELALNGLKGSASGSGSCNFPEKESGLGKGKTDQRTGIYTEGPSVLATSPPPSVPNEATLPNSPRGGHAASPRGCAPTIVLPDSESPGATQSDPYGDANENDLSPRPRDLLQSLSACDGESSVLLLAAVKPKEEKPEAAQTTQLGGGCAKSKAAQTTQPGGDCEKRETVKSEAAETTQPRGGCERPKEEMHPAAQTPQQRKAGATTASEVDAKPRPEVETTPHPLPSRALEQTPPPVGLAPPSGGTIPTLDEPETPCCVPPNREVPQLLPPTSGSSNLALTNPTAPQGKQDAKQGKRDDTQSKADTGKQSWNPSL